MQFDAIVFNYNLKMKELAKPFDIENKEICPIENLYDTASERDYNHRDFRFL